MSSEDEIYRCLLLGKKALDCSKEQRHHLASKGPSSQSYAFFNSHVWMWELGYKEGWVLKNWCFGTVVLEKTFESPLHCKEIQPVYSEGNQPWVFIERPDAEAETPNSLATWYEESPHLKRLWYWERVREIVEDRGSWQVAVHGVTKSRTQHSHSTTTECY